MFYSENILAGAQQSPVCSRRTKGMCMLVNQSNELILIDRTPGKQFDQSRNKWTDSYLSPVKTGLVLL